MFLSNGIPVAFEAFTQYQLESSHLSANALNCIKKLLSGENVSQETSGMGKREWLEFCQIIYKTGI